MLKERIKKILQQNTLIEQFNNNWILSHTKTSHTTNAETNKHISNNDVISSSVSSVKQSNMTCNECITELQKICVTDKVQLKYITLHLLEATRKYY